MEEIAKIFKTDVSTGYGYLKRLGFKKEKND